MADVELVQRRLNLIEFIDYVTVIGADPVEILRILVHETVPSYTFANVKGRDGDSSLQSTSSFVIR